MQGKAGIIGFVGGAAAVAMVVAVMGAAAAPGGPHSGRFQMEANERRAYLVDTATGQVWSSSGQAQGDFAAPKLAPAATE